MGYDGIGSMVDRVDRVVRSYALDVVLDIPSPLRRREHAPLAESRSDRATFEAW